MKNKVTRLFSLLLVLILAVSLIPMNASAEINYGEYSCTFTTFDELKQIITNSSTNWAYYSGTEPLVIESSLTLPAGFYLDSLYEAELQIPAGVTFRTNDYLYFETITVDGTLLATEFEADNLIVNGALTADSIGASDSLSGNGTIKCRNRLTATVPSMDAIDVNKIDLSTSAMATLRYQVTSMADLEELHALASADSRTQMNYVAYIFKNPLSITKTFVFPENSSLSIGQPLTIEEDCTVEVNSHTAIVAPVAVDGTFVNNSIALVSNAGSGNGSLSFSDSGAYSGSGTLIVVCESRDAISSTISGIDLSHFKTTEHTDTDYELGIAGLRWHLEYMGPDYVAPETEPTEPVDPSLPTITGTYTTDLTMSSADLGVNAPDSVLRATLTFTEDGKVSTTWEAVDVTALQQFFHGMFVNSYYAMAYGAGITDINEIEAYCMSTTGMSVSDYMAQIVPYDAIRLAFTPVNTHGTYSYNDDHTAIFTDMTFMDVASDASIANSFVIGGNTLYLNAASWGKSDYTFVCTAR